MRRALWLTVVLLTATVSFADDVGVRKLNLDEISPATGDVSAGQPSREQLGRLAQEGYVAVIDLRGEGESRGYDEPAAATESGLEYTPLPIASADDINVENARRLGELLDSYDGPVVVHCGSGNRVGALVALLEADRGASAEDALEAGRAAGLTRLEDLVKDRLETDDGSN